MSVSLKLLGIKGHYERSSSLAGPVHNLRLFYMLCCTVWEQINDDDDDDDDDNFVTALFAFVVLGLVSSVLSQEFGWEERLQNDLFCVEWEP